MDLQNGISELWAMIAVFGILTGSIALRNSLFHKIFHRGVSGHV